MNWWSVFYGMLILLLGLSIMLLIYYVTRILPNRKRLPETELFPLSKVELVESEDAVLLIGSGGRVVYANALAKDWFGYSSGVPNLERLLQRTQPKDVLLSLCTKEGQARFSIDGRLTEGVSHAIPSALKEGPNGHSVDRAILVTLRRPNIAIDKREENQSVREALEIFTSLNQRMASSLELIPTITSILESVEQLISADWSEVTIYDPANQSLIPYRFIGAPGPDRRLERSAENYSIERGYSGYLYSNQKPLLIENVDTFTEARPAVSRVKYKFNSYLGTPLMVDGTVIGTLELAGQEIRQFDKEHQETLKLLVPTASLAIKNAVRYEEEKHRVLELSGLTNLSKAMNNLTGIQDLFTQLVEGVSNLIEVKVLGFLMYHESHHLLEAQPPFRGIPEQLLDLYRVEIPVDSRAEEIVLSQDRIIAEKASEDATLKAMGLDGMAVASGIQNTVLLPLKTPTRLLGYMQVGDRLDGLKFDQESLRLLEIIAVQSSAIIENAMLVKESQSRAQRSETLRRVASLAGSSATLDEIMIHSLRELVRLLRSDVGLLYLLDEYLGDLYLHPASLLSSGERPNVSIKRINMTEAVYKDTVTGSMQSIFLKDLNELSSLPEFYIQVFESMDVRSVLIVPLVVRGQGVGEMILASFETNHFDQNDLTLVSTTGSQLSVAIEKNALYGQTDESLRRRVVQLLALNRVSRELSTTLELRRLLQVVYEQVVQTTEADCGAIFLFDQMENALVNPKVSFHVGDSVSGSLTPIEQRVLRAGDPYIVKDYLSPDPNSPDTMPIPPHPNVRSSLIVPIAYQNYVAGLIHLHALEADRFDATSQEIAQSLAVQAAIAIGNAQRYQEQQNRNELLNRRVDTLTALLDTTKFLEAGQPLSESLESIAYGIQSSTGFNKVLISVYRPENGRLDRIAAAGIPIDEFSELQEEELSWDEVITKLKPEYKFGKCYYIPHDQGFDIPTERIIPTPDPVNLNQYSDELAWHEGDQLLVLLEAGDGIPLGIISVDEPQNNLRPDRLAIDSLEIFSNQTGLILGTYNQIYRLSSKAEALQVDLRDSKTSLETTRQELVDLIESEQQYQQKSDKANHQLKRLQAYLNIADQVDQQSSREGVLQTLAAHIKDSLEMDVVLVGELGESGPRLLHTVGTVPEGVSLQALLGQRNPLRSCLQTGTAIYEHHFGESDRVWTSSPLLTSLNCHSFFCQPILYSLDGGPAIPASKSVDAAVLAISTQEIPYFDYADEELFALVSRQVTIALTNLRTITDANRRLQEMNLLLEFSRQLGTIDTHEILQTLVDGVQAVIPAAEAGMAALWQKELDILWPEVAVGYPDNQNILKIPYRVGESLPGEVFSKGQVLRQPEVLFAQDYNLQQEHLLLYRDATQGRLPISAMIVPLQTFDSKLGVLVLDNFSEPDAFSEDDEVLVLALARQTALTLQNVNLYQATQERTAQLQTLTMVAGTITSSLQTEDLIHSLLDQVGSLVPFDTGILWLRQGDQMTVRAASGFDDQEQREGLSVALDDSLLLRDMATNSQPLYVPDVRRDERFPSLLEHQYLSWLGLPLLSKGEMIGVIVLEKTEPNFYTPEHIQALVTFSGQAAVALENANLYEESLRRASELDERSQRLVLLNRLSTTLSGTLDLEQVLRDSAKEMLQASSGSVISVALINDNDRVEVLIEDPMIHETLPIILSENPVVERIMESLGIFSSEDIEQEELGGLEEYLSLIGTKSLLIVPLVTGSNFLGLTMIHALEPARFSSDEVALVNTINNQVAVAIQNARLFRQTEQLMVETQERSGELAALFELGVQFTQVLDFSRLLDITFENVNRLINPDAIAISMMDSEEKMTVYIEEQKQRQDPKILDRTGESFSEYVVRNNEALLIQDTQAEDLPVPGITVGKPIRSWLGVPLVMRGVTNGVISVQNMQPYAFSEQELHLVSQIANQLSVAIDNAQLFETVQTYTEELEERVSDRTAEVEREHQRIQTLLSITTELSASLDLDMVLSRTLDVVNETIDAEHGTILLIQPDSPFLYLRASQGYTGTFPQSGQVSRLKRNEGLAGWVINNRQAVLIDDLHKDERWELKSDKTNLHRSAMIVPLLVGEEILGVMMVYHRSPLMFNADQLDLIQAVAKQIAIAINNTQLYGLIRDQAERLGDMLRTQHVETSRSQAILEAVADGVLVTDARRTITLFNASAEHILSLSRSDVLGRSLEQFIGLFGNAAQSWVQTIRTWSEDPERYEIGEIYAEQIELENRRVVSVHLSPVHLRSDFLGTVSIFRDITHQVEVDRLKSEFVATVSHELRTPMTSIKGYVEVLLLGAAGELNPQQINFLEVVKGNTERLAVLVNDLLDISRIEAGKVTLSVQPIDLRPMVEEIAENLLERMAEENRVLHIEVDIVPDLPVIAGDPERIRQIMDNLIINSYQYTPVGGNINVSMRVEGRYVQIDIRDDGIGIKPEDQGRVFERFYRGEDPLVLATSGTGLGLSIVQTLIEMHKGRIWFESEGIPGRGSVFSFTLPIHESALSKNAEIENTVSPVEPVEDEDPPDDDWVMR